MRYFGLLWVQLRASLQVTMQYRAEFFLGAFMALFYLFWNLVPMFVLWSQRPTIAGWSLPEAMLVTAWFTLLRSLLDGAVQPSLAAVVEHIRKGTLDFVLLKPADAQFLVSTAKFEVLSFVDALAAIGMMAWSLHELHRIPTAPQLATALVLTFAAAALLYAISILVISAAFYVVRLDNLIYLFNSVFDAGRWPASVFRGIWRFLFTFVVPLALMTTYPALALLGRLAPQTTVRALAGAALFVTLARVVWRRSIGHYRSASS
ncbi:MAG TPA: ABC-2 family transporter protein [Polyangia bacterium]|jgi:ABC-2 type transport system permease protein|nr:ABC-2 family transporter protein [Polyangia bacterium]